MRFFRTVLAVVIALSVAMLPAVGSAMPFAGTVQKAASEAMAKDMDMASDMSGAMDECCPDHARTKPCDQPSDQCPLVFCVGQAMGLAFTADFSFALPMPAGNLLPIPVDQVVASHSGSPPFRPPRV